MSLDSLADVARMASRLPEELQKAQRRGVTKAALVVTRGIRGEIRSASGGDNRLSGVGKRGARVGAKYDVKGSTDPTALIRATGPLQLLEHPTRAHDIAPRKRGKKRALRLRDGTFAARAHHPGTRPSRPFEKGYMKTRDQSGPAMDREIQDGIRKALA